jgi:hypothetical protein
LSASITRESSPPDAIFSIGPRGSPGLAEIRQATRSKPDAVQLPSSSEPVISNLKRAFIASSLMARSTVLSSLRAAS